MITYIQPAASECAKSRHNGVTRKSLLLALAAVAGVSACGEAPSGPPFLADVLTFTGFDLDSETAAFEIAPHELPNLIDLETLSGLRLRIRRGGVLNAREHAGSVIDDGRFSGGDALDLRYAMRDGIIVPKDYPTLIMMSAYHEFSRLFESLPDAAAMTVDDLVAENGAFEVFFEPTVKVMSSRFNTKTTDKLNAFYVSGTNQFGLAQRSPLERTPLAANRIVLAHELGHAVFGKAFADDEPKRASPLNEGGMFPGRAMTEYAIAGLNEGFADFFAFVITGATNPLSELSHLVGAERSLARTDYTWDDVFVDPILGEPLNEPLEDGPCMGSFYCIGTLFARSMYQAAVETGTDPASYQARTPLGRAMVGALPHVLPRMRTLASDILPERESARESNYTGRLTGAYLGCLVAALPPSMRPGTCRAFVRNFGDFGFPTNTRFACP